MQRSTFLRFELLAAAALAAASSVGCADEGESDVLSDSTSVVQAPIEDGTNDGDDLGVLRIVRPRLSEVPNDKGGQCSGVVIAPDLVLTARHCVSALDRGESLCEGTTFYPPQTLTVELVELSTAFESFSVPAENVGVPAAGDSICGYDVALVRVPGLAKALAKRGVAPLEPRFESNVASGEAYRAVGLGAYNANGQGVGTRRERGGLSVDCAGAGCASTGVGSREWRGSDAICSGDSGGPALDENGRVIGVVSRANSNDCSKPVYASVFAWRDWLREGALEAARLGGHQPPAWSTSTFATGEVFVDSEFTADESENGCSAGGAPGGRGGWSLVAFAAAATLAASRRRRAAA
ncbi:MAG TPA: trypsin-like serine protease, partial [Polyangiaceae bacterium]|nr:trypsin-like serine protease [Polyangiaceae bacterium]